MNATILQWRRARLLCLLPLLLASCKRPTASDQTVDPGVVLASGYWIPDGLAVIGEGEFLFADRSGELYHYSISNAKRVAGVPASKTWEIYGGLLDVSLHPGFAENRLVYMAYTDASLDLSVARFELRDDRAEHLTVIYKSDEFSIGSRIVWQDPSHFFLSFGIGGDPFPEVGSQDLGSDRGKIHRLMADGTIPSDNPIFPGASAPSTIWSYGHRNPQGLHYDASAGKLYAIEHGPLGGDELNIVVAARNYGWPLFSYGRNYDQSAVSNMSEADARAVSVMPAKYWTPDNRVAPSGLLSLDGAFLFGALRQQHLLRYDPSTDVTQIVFAKVGRVRDVARMPSGKLLIAIDRGSPMSADRGRIIEISPP
jgi:aldose sugar dehydrogenase